MFKILKHLYHTRTATIRLCHDTIRITIQVSRYDSYLDTFHLYKRLKNNRKIMKYKGNFEIIKDTDMHIYQFYVHI